MLTQNHVQITQNHVQISRQESHLRKSMSRIQYHCTCGSLMRGTTRVCFMGERKKSLRGTTRKLPMPCNTLLYPSNVKIETKKLPTPCHTLLCPSNVKIETKKSRLPPINSGQRTHIHEDKKHIETTQYKERGSQNNQDVKVLQFYLLIEVLNRCCNFSYPNQFQWIDGAGRRRDGFDS